MLPDADAFRDQLAAGMNAAQQGLFDLCRASMWQTGRSLHLAAFSAACLALHHASAAEVDLGDVQPLAERALRQMAAEWDARPVVRSRQPILSRLFSAGERDAAPAQLSTEALFRSLPGADHAEPGARGTYAVARFRQYLEPVFVYSCQPGHVGAWDADGRARALDRALVADLYAPEHCPTLDASPGLFGLVLERVACSTVP